MNDYDVIIVGGGVGGMTAALELDPSLRVLVVSKRDFPLCNTSLAQGGMVSVYDLSRDNYADHIRDTMIAGHEENRLEAVTVLSKESKLAADELTRFGVDFDREPDGSYSYGLEGGHGRNRILHHRDYSGREIEQKLIAEAQRRDNLTLLEWTQMADIRQVNGGFRLNFLRQDGSRLLAGCRFCVFATGGIGRLFPYTTNSAIATGDGIAAAWRMGAKIEHLSYVQFHPTAFHSKDRECFLISEAVRGAGAYLRNCKGERFMQRYDERLELAPRDVVSQSIMQEQRRTGSDKFYLDISHKPASFIRERFPMICDNLAKHGYDLTTQPVPIYPCQHYLMGGIDVDLYARTSVSRLYAVGECSHTGVHGRNRLASNSLLEGVVFGRRAALDISARAKQDKAAPEECAFAPDTAVEPLPSGTRTELREIMRRATFVLPNKAQAQAGYVRVCDIRFMLEHGDFKVTPDLIEARSMAVCAYLILKEIL